MRINMTRRTDEDPATTALLDRYAVEIAESEAELAVAGVRQRSATRLRNRLAQIGTSLRRQTVALAQKPATTSRTPQIAESPFTKRAKAGELPVKALNNEPRL